MTLKKATSLDMLMVTDQKILSLPSDYSLETEGSLSNGPLISNAVDKAHVLRGICKLIQLPDFLGRKLSTGFY